MAELLLLAVAASLANQCAFLGQFGPRCAVPARHRVAAASALGITALCTLPLAAASTRALVAALQTPSTPLATLLLAVLTASLAAASVALVIPRLPSLRETRVELAPPAVASQLILALACLRPDQCASVADALGRGATTAAAFAVVQALFTPFAKRLVGGDEPASLGGVPALATATGLLMLGIAGLDGLVTP